MLALISYSDERPAKRRVRLSDCEAAGMRAVDMRIPRLSGRRAERALRAAAAALCRLSISTVCFSADFDRRVFFAEHGFYEPETRRFLAEKSSEILIAACPSADSVAVLGGMADAASVAALNRVWPRFRNLIVDLGSETGHICAVLRRKTGASVIEAPEESILRHAGAAIVFRGAGERRLDENCVVLCADRAAEKLIHGGRLICAVEFDAAESVGQFPLGFDRTQLLAAAFNGQKLSTDCAAVKRVQFAERHLHSQLSKNTAF